MTEGTGKSKRRKAAGGNRSPIDSVPRRPLPSAWRSFATDLVASLPALEDEYLALSVRGTNRFVQFMAQGAFGMRVESVSDYFLPEGEHLDEADHRRLMKLGWHAPTTMNVQPKDDPDGSPNYFLDLPSPVPLEDVANMAALTLISVHGAAHPGELEYKRGKAIRANPLPKLLSAAQNGEAAAQYELAIRYREGEGVPQSLSDAFKWFWEAGSQNHLEALRELGTMFRFGHGTERNLVTAAEFHLIAAMEGDVVAIGSLSEYLDELRSIALSGNPTASWFLSRIYNHGRGAERSMPLTWTWIKWARQHCPPSDCADEAAEIEDAHGFFKISLSSKDRKEGERVLMDLIVAAGKAGRPKKPLVKRKRGKT